MKYRPDESTLISWMYGELDAAERAKVDAYFAEHPEELNAIRKMQDAREVMSHVADKEVIAPPLIMDGTPVVSLWRSTWVRASISIAASFLLIVVAGKMLGPNISYSNGELKISFRDTPAQIVEPAKETLTQGDVQQMINASMKESEGRLSTQLASAETKLNAAVRNSLKDNTTPRMDTLVRQISRASEEQIRTFVAGLRQENLQMMQQYLSLTAAEQRSYMENLLVDFSKWQQEQRNQDLLLFQTRVNNLEQNTNQLKEETEQILASLISNGGISDKNSN